MRLLSYVSVSNSSQNLICIEAKIIITVYSISTKQLKNRNVTDLQPHSDSKISQYFKIRKT